MIDSHAAMSIYADSYKIIHIRRRKINNNVQVDKMTVNFLLLKFHRKIQSNPIQLNQDVTKHNINDFF